MACFADTNVSQGSVATYSRRGGILNIYFNYKFTKESSGEKKSKSAKIRQNYSHESVAHFLGHPVQSGGVTALRMRSQRQQSIAQTGTTYNTLERTGTCFKLFLHY